MYSAMPPHPHNPAVPGGPEQRRPTEGGASTSKRPRRRLTGGNGRIRPAASDNLSSPVFMETHVSTTSAASRRDIFNRPVRWNREGAESSGWPGEVLWKFRGFQRGASQP
ncbi:hypothetical protein EYF80_043825 [Liparis tanakae]|uniref:Uncharacterized protein n=1 Tax=Liparis tanakae TaxID=230148 RepID=A0A4Z2FZG3_9TELE|nr:hypothetical protein EYF80_043825 [Liparis tanakae]